MEILAGVEVDPRRLSAICAKYGIARLWVFGSTARGTATEDSDINLIYTLQPGRRLGWDIEDLSDDLADLLGRPIDLISRHAIHERLRAAVLADARQLYAA